MRYFSLLMCSFLLGGCGYTAANYGKLLNTPVGSTVTYKEIDGCNTITIDGDITNDTYIKLEELYNKYKEFKSVSINSNGGDVWAAINIGFLFREYRECLTVLSGDFCNSACVFALAGAPYRNVIGKVGIHRPIIRDDELETPSDQKKKYEYSGKVIKYFFECMNIPTLLYDVMLKTPPSKIKYLSKNELVSYKLSENDPYYEKARAANYSKQMGIAKTEYERRMKYIDDVCYKHLPDTDKVALCYKKVRDTGKE